jgi:hypothetical protein
LREISPLGVRCKSHPARYDLNPPPFQNWLTQGSTREVTAESYAKRVRLLGKFADVENPEKVRAVICAYPVSEARKQLLAHAYSRYCEFKGYTWDKPRFTREQAPIFLPLENELDALIANTREKMSVFLQRARFFGGLEAILRRLSLMPSSLLDNLL